MAAEIPPLDEEKTVMLREIALQPQFVHDNIDGVLARARAAVAARAGRCVRSGIAVGCGDSYCAGLALRAYVSAQTGCWFEPLEALEFARYLSADMPADTFVFGISNSGSVARTIEAIAAARARGAWTFAITVNAHSALAHAAETLVQLAAVPNIKVRADGSKLVTPGSISYTASLVGVCAAAIALGEGLGRLGAADVDAAAAALHRLADAMAQADAVVAAGAPALAATFARDRTMVIAGGGPNAATAYFGAAKFYEAVQWPVHHAQIEEWAHEQYFFTGPATDTIVLAPPGGSHARALEQLRAARELGSRTIAIGAADDAALSAAADVVIGMPSGIPEALTPFVYKLPFEYLSAHVAARHGIDFFGFANPLRQEVNFRQIFDSARR